MYILLLKYFKKNLSVEFHIKIYIKLDFEDIKFYTELNFVKIEFQKQVYFAK